MSWFSRSNITSLTGQFTEQLSSFTRDVLTEEDAAAIREPACDLAEAHRRIEELEKTAAKLREETIRYKRAAIENEDRAKVAEIQVERLHCDNNSVEKDRRIEDLQRQLEEFQQSIESRSRGDTFDSQTDWNDFGWNESESGQSAVLQVPSENSNLKQLEQENIKLTEEIETLKEDYLSEISELKQELAIYKNKISKVETFDFSCQFSDSGDESIPEHPENCSRESQTEHFIIPDFDPNEYISLENYSCNLIKRHLPKLSAALDNLLTENVSLKESLSHISLELERQTVRSEGSGADSNGSWHLVASKHSNLCSSPPIGGSKPESPDGSRIEQQQSDTYLAHTIELCTFNISELWLNSTCAKSLSEGGINVDILRKAAEDLQVFNFIGLAVKLASNKEELQHALSKIQEEYGALSNKLEQVANINDTETDASILREQNQCLQRRLEEVGRALEKADQQLEKIENHQAGNFFGDFELPIALNDDELDSLKTELSETKELLQESLHSNKTMAEILEDQKEHIEELQSEKKSLMKEQEDSKDLTKELTMQLQSLNAELEQRPMSREKEDDHNNNINDGVSESQLSLITSMQTEIATLKKKLSKFSESDSDVGSRDSSPVKFFLGGDERSHVEKALLDKEEVILKLTREVESLKASLTSLSNEDNTRIETQLELTSLKDELMNLQNALEKQEDMISEKETSIGYLKLDLIEKEEKLSTALESLSVKNGEIKTLLAEKEKLELLMINLADERDEWRGKYEETFQKWKEVQSDLQQCMQKMNAVERKAEELTNEVEHLKEVENDKETLLQDLKEKLEQSSQQYSSLLVALEQESSEKEVSIEKISQLAEKLKSTQKNLEHEKNVSADFSQKCSDLMEKLGNMSNETDGYGKRLSELSEKLANSVNEKCNLNSKLNNLMGERQNLLGSIESMKSEKSQLMKHINDLKSELRKTKEICEQLTLEIEQLVSKRSSDEDSPRETAILRDNEQAEVLKSEIDRLNEKISELEKSLDESRASNELLSQNLAVKEDILRSLQLEFSTICKALEAIFQTSECEDISTIVTYMRSEIERLTSEVHKGKEDLNECDSSLKQLESDLAAKTDQLVAREINFEETKRQLTESRKRLDEYTERNRELIEEMELLQETNGNLETSVADLQKYLKISEDRLSEVMKGDWENRLEQERQVVSTQKSQLQELRGLVESYEKQLDEAVEDYEMMKERYQSVSQQVSGNSLAFQQEINELKQSKQAIERENEALTEQMWQLEERASSLTEQLKTSFDNSKAKDSVINEKEAMIANLKVDISNCNQELKRAKSSLNDIQDKFGTQLSDNHKMADKHVEDCEKITKLESENDQLKTKNEALTEILSENEQGWNQKFKQQQEEFEKYAQQAYAVRAHYDQLLFAYNQKTQEVSDLEQSNGELRDQISQLEEKILDMTSSFGASDFPSEQVEEEGIVFSADSKLQATNDQAVTSLENKKLYEEVNLLKEEIVHLKDQLNEKNSQLDQSKIEVVGLNQKLEKKVDEMKDVRVRNDKMSAELGRLREHMLQMEEGYTHEALVAEDREKNLRTKLFELESKLEKFTISNSSIDSQTLSKLAEKESQLEALIFKSNNLERELSDTNDQMQLYKDASQNLQLVLENFQKEKQRELKQLEEGMEAKLLAATEQKSRLETKLSKQNSKLDKQQKLLEQAAHLNSELELREEEIERLRSEIDSQVAQVAKWKKKAQEALGLGDRVEKQLVKNLLVAYLTVPNNKKPDALAMIARFLEFSEDERTKVGIGQQRGWFSGWMAAPSGQQAAYNKSQESFTQKFIEFLETESSQPQVVALPHHHLNPDSASGSSNASEMAATSTGSNTQGRFKASGGFNPFSPSVLPQMKHSPNNIGSSPLHSTENSRSSRQSSVSSTTTAFQEDTNSSFSKLSSDQERDPAVSSSTSGLLGGGNFLKELLNDE